MKLTDRDLKSVASSRVFSRRLLWRIAGAALVVAGVMFGLAYLHNVALGIGFVVIFALCIMWGRKMDKRTEALYRDLKAEYERDADGGDR